MNDTTLDTNKIKESPSKPQTENQDKNPHKEPEENTDSRTCQTDENSDIKIGKLFVGGLPFTSNDNALYDYFIQFGEIKEAVVIRDRLTGASKGYGFVTMKDHQSATEALKNPNPYIDGRRCNINYAFKNTKRRDKIYPEGMGRYRHQYVPQQQPLWGFGFDPYSLYDYRQQHFNFMNYPCINVFNFRFCR